MKWNNAYEAQLLAATNWSERAGTLGETQWRAIAAYCTRLLERDLRCPLGVCDEDYGDGFSIGLRCIHVALPIRPLRLRATLGADIVDDRLLVHCWLFIYSGEELLTLHSGEPVLVLRLELTEQGPEWREIAWDHGYPGEYDGAISFVRP